jgi:T-complex protein 1 subunit eta
VLLAFAKALEIIPRQICDNAGLDSTDVLNKLRARHHTGDRNYGVDVDGPEGVRDNMEAFVWEPSLVKLNAISSAAEAACLILSVDETVRNPQSEAVCTTLLFGGSVPTNPFVRRTLDRGLLQERRSA